jgi:hypothetical protein
MSDRDEARTAEESAAAAVAAELIAGIREIRRDLQISDGPWEWLRCLSDWKTA